MAITAIQGLSAFTLPETTVWIGEVGSKWSNADNWSTGVVPGSEDVVSFNQSSPACTVDVATVTIAGLITTAEFANTIDATGATFTVANGLNLSGGTITGSPDVIFLGGSSLNHTRNANAPASYQFGTIEFRSSGTTITPSFDTNELTFSILIVGPDAQVQLTSELVQHPPSNAVAMDALAVAGSLSFGDINLRVDALLRLYDDGGSIPPTIAITAATEITGYLDFRGTEWDLQAGSIVVGRYQDWVLGTATGLTFTDAAGDQQPKLALGEPLYLRVTDLDSNLDSAVAETIAVKVTNPDLTAIELQEQEFVTLTETGPSTGIFTNLDAGFPTNAATEAVVGDGVLSIPVIANLEAFYADGPNETNSYDFIYGTAAHFWVGGGETMSWYDSSNWFTNEIPSTSATAIFGKTDAPCLVDDDVTISDLRCEPVYQGTVTLAAQLSCSTLRMENGVLNDTAAAVTLRLTGDLLQNGGSIDTGQTTLWLNGSNQQNIVFDNATIAGIGFAASVVLSGSSTINGPIDLAGFLTVDGSHSCTSLLMEDFNNLTLTAGSTLRITEQFTTGVSTDGQVAVVVEDGGLLDLGTAAWTQTTVKLTENGSGYVHYPANSLTFLDANGEPVSSHVAGDLVRLSITDLDVNTDNTIVETITVTVRDLVSGDVETVVLTETSANSGQFSNTANGLVTSTSAGSVAIDDSVLDVAAIAGTAYLQASYQDSQDPADSLQEQLIGGAIYWDDDSEDGLWSTATNWSGDTLPTTTSTVLFGPEALSDCSLTENVQVATLITTAVYSGSIDNNGSALQATEIQFHGGNLAENAGLFCTGSANLTSPSLSTGLLIMDTGSSTLTSGSVTMNGFTLLSDTLTWQASGTTLGSFIVSSLSDVTFTGTTSIDSVSILGLLTIGPESSMTVNTTFSQVQNDPESIVPRTLLDGGQMFLSGSLFRSDGTIVEQNGGSVQSAASLGVVPSDGTPLTLGVDSLSFNVTDKDEDNGLAPSVQVIASSPDTGDSESIMLISDSELAYRFISEAALSTAESTTAIPADGILQAAAGETLVFTYQDGEDPGDTAQQSLTTQGDVPPPVLPTVNLVADDLLLFEGQSADVGLTLSAASNSTVSVQLRITDPSETGLGENDFAGDFTVAIPAGATTATVTLQSTQDELPEAIGRGRLLLASADGADLAEAAQAVAIELRDDDADGEPLALTLASFIEVATVGSSITLFATDGTPPYSFSATNAVFSASPQLNGAYDLDSDGDNDLGQRLLLTPLAVGQVSVTVSDAEGTSSDLTLAAVAGSPSSTPPPSVPVSDGVAAIYLPIAAATAEGRQRLIDLATEAADDEQRLFAWSAADQIYVELPDQPTGGLLPGQGIFLASRETLALDLSGSAAALPYDILLAPGWNFIGVPALAAAETVFDYATMPLYDEGRFSLGTATQQDLIGEHAFFWDGVAYQEATTLVPGNGYWIFNASADPAQSLTLRLASSGQVTATLATTATTNGHRWQPAASGPPVPPSASTGGTSSTAAPGGGCGSGIALLMLPLLLLGFARWQRAG